MANSKQPERVGVEKLCNELQIFTLSAEIHGGAKGLYDLGPHGSAIVNNLISEWRKHFIHAEEMLEVKSAILTPHSVLKASGHVDRFHDLMVQDEETKQAMRADHLLEDHMETLIKSGELSKEEIEKCQLHLAKADAYSREELGAILKEYNIVNPETGNPVTDPFEFKLMFATQFGPSSDKVVYLRPETAQGIFCNFKKLLEYHMGKMPFAAAQIGLAFRNEISPRGGLIRLREFLQMEIEHFFNKDSPDHESFNEVADTRMLFFSSEAQLNRGEAVEMSIGEAVEKGVVCNSTLGYYLARTWTYLERVGIDISRTRFRQHLPTEMAHYAKDCWDAEIKIFGDWVECVGVADRGNHDLSEHIRVTNRALTATEVYDTPRMVEKLQVRANFKELGMALKGVSKAAKSVVFQYFKNISEDCAATLAEKLKNGPVVMKGSDLGGGSADFTCTPEMISVQKKMVKVSVNKYVPSVVEPSFGLSRILYALMAHSFEFRPMSEDAKEDDLQKIILKLKPNLAPSAFGVLPLSNSGGIKEMAAALHKKLRMNDIRCSTDTSAAAIGRRYVRMDKAGVPYVITVDFTSVKDNSLTLRERDSMEQVRLPGDVDLLSLLHDLQSQRKAWEDIVSLYPKVEAVN